MGVIRTEPVRDVFPENPRRLVRVPRREGKIFGWQ
jgi:hypothetical protein